MSAWDKIDLATNWQPAPNFIYDKVEFAQREYRKIIHHRVDQSFGYLLRNVTISLPTFVLVQTGQYRADGGQTPEIEFYVRRQSRQSQPIPIQTITSPCSEGEWFMSGNSTMSGDNWGGIRAVTLKSYILLNWFFQFGDTIEFHIIRYPNVADGITIPQVAYRMHSVFKGYDVPEPQARIW